MTQHEIVRSVGDFDQSLLVNKRHERGCDVEVVFNEQRIPLHNVVLGGNSRFFEVNLFSTPIVPSVITLENVNTEATEAIIEYCYSGKMKLHENDAINILETANILGIQPVIDGCCKIIISTLDSENCFAIWRLSRKLRLISLENKSFDYIRTTFNGITTDFLTINLTELIKILQSGLFDCTMEKYLTLIKDWINFDPEVRKKNLMDLLKYVRLEQLHLNILASQSKNLCFDKNCFDLFVKAFNEQPNLDILPLQSTLVVLGGERGKECKIVETYDTQSNTWKQREVQFGKSLFCSVFYDQRVYVLSGHKKNSVECYDIKTWRKTSLAPLQKARYWFSAVVVGEYIYAFGGVTTLGTAERYNVKKNEWTQLTDMPTGRDSHKLAVIDEEIFIIGGKNNSGGLDTIECYTISTRKWRSCARMKEKRIEPAVAAIRGFVFAAGGYDGYNKLSSVERYDPNVDQWTFIEPLSSPRSGAVLVNVCDSLIISGGQSKIVEKYDFLKKQWSPMPSLNRARRLHDMIVVSQNLLD